MHLAAHQIEIDAVEGAHAGELFGEAADLEDPFLAAPRCGAPVAVAGGVLPRLSHGSGWLS